MSRHPLSRILTQFARAKCKKPDGCYTAEECAARWGKDAPCSVDKAKSILGEMVQAGTMAEVRGSRLTASGQIVPCVYYRIVRKKAGK